MPTEGVLYIVFGSKAREAAQASILSLQKFHPDLPIKVIGDMDARTVGCGYIPWEGESPYDPTAQPLFHFRAGRVKPSMYDLSPFDRTLYVDADTEFQANIQVGFDLLDRFDFMVAKHSFHSVGMLTMVSTQDKRATVTELGNDSDHPYPNSGVLFWKKCPGAEKLFKAWREEWMRFQEWDEQLSLMRAIYKNPLRMLLLPESWNGENRKEGRLIFHDFHGNMSARSYHNENNSRNPVG